MGVRSPRAGWAPVLALLDGSPAAQEQIASLVDETARQLGAVDRWVAGSVWYQAWAAHLTSVHAASARLGSSVPDLSASNLRYRRGSDGRLELGANPLTRTDTETAWQHLTAHHLDPLATALRSQVRVGRRLLAGNVASALAGSLGALARAGLGPLDALVEEPWAQPPDIRALGTWMVTDGAPRYQRTTCCGYERLPGAGRCGDCSLNRRGQAGR